jgi:hypothetical protein
MSYVQSAQLDTTGTSANLAYPSNTGAGNLLLLAVRKGGSTDDLTSGPDSAGNLWLLATKKSETADHWLYLYYAGAAVGGPDTVTVNVGASSTLRMAILEYNDFVGTGATLDQAISAEGNSTTPDSGSVATTAAVELLVSVASVSGNKTFTAGSGYTAREEVVTKMSTEDQAVSSLGTYAGTWTLDASDNWACLLATFKAITPPLGADRAPSLWLLMGAA